MSSFSTDGPNGPAPQGPDPATLEERAELPLTDLGFARRLAAVYRDEIVYTPELGWGTWTGACYQFGTGSKLDVRSVGFTLSELLREEVEVWAAAPVPQFEARRLLEAELRKQKPAFMTEEEAETAVRAKRRREHEKAIEKVQAMNTVRNVVEAAEHLCRIEFESLDADPYYLAVTNGAIDLRKAVDKVPKEADEDLRQAWREGWFMPANRKRRPSRACGVRFDPAAECPGWRRFISLVTSKPDRTPDPKMAAYLQRCCGRTVFGQNSPPAAFLLQGEGSNGKSTLMRRLAQVLGTYAAHVPIQMFLDTGEERSSAAAAPDEVRLPGARLYLASEPKHGARLSDAKIKQLAGGDRRTSRPNFGEFFEWEPVGHPMLAFNPMPTVAGADHGTHRRLLFVPFRVRLDDLPDDLRRDPEDVEAELSAELPGILNWLIEGFVEVRQLGGVCPPEDAQVFKEAMLDDSDPVGQFVAECFESVPGAGVSMPDFHKVFPIWAEDNAQRELRKTTVRKIMMQRGYQKKITRGVHMWANLVWREEDHVDALRTRAGCAPT
ncbi:MAG: phage/plasmid primase, P4 family [Pseudomonadota bacterium]